MNLVESISNPIFAKQTSSAGLSLSEPPLTLEDFCPRGCDLPYPLPPGSWRAPAGAQGQHIYGWAGRRLRCHTSVFCFATAKTLRR